MGTAVQKTKISNAQVENPSRIFCQENAEAQKKKQTNPHLLNIKEIFSVFN